MSPPTGQAPQASRGALAAVERIGNKLPDPAVLFIALLLAVWVLSWIFSLFSYEQIDPRTGEALVVVNQLSAAAMTQFLSSMVTTFAHFHPIGVVLVAQPSFIFGPPPDTSTSSTVGGGSGTPEQQSIAIGLAFGAAVAAALAFLAIRRVNVRDAPTRARAIAQPARLDADTNTSIDAVVLVTCSRSHP